MTNQTHENQMRRYYTKEELMAYYDSWVSKNGIPKIEQGCINCAELVCFDNCQGILDKRVHWIRQ